MITGDADSESEDESDEGEVVSEEEMQEAPKTTTEHSSSSVNHEWGAPLTDATTPRWGNNERIEDPAIANEWKSKATMMDRRSREEEIRRGGSPPPKLDEENIFSEGNSRQRTKPAYRDKSELTDKVEEKFRSSVERYTSGRFNSTMNQKRKKAMQESPAPSKHGRKGDRRLQRECFWSSKCCYEKNELHCECCSSDDENKDEDKDRFQSSSMVPKRESSKAKPTSSGRSPRSSSYSDEERQEEEKDRLQSALEVQKEKLSKAKPTSWGRSPRSSSCSVDDNKDMDEDSGTEESSGEESSSEGEDDGEPPRENGDPDDSDGDDGTIWQIFKEIRNGTYN
jgi:hypothetical protein